VTIARRRGVPMGAVAAIAPAPPAAPATAPLVGVPVPLGDEPAPDAITPVGRLRRCTFRRVDRVESLPQRTELPTYEAMCLYVDRDEPLSLGDVEEAQPICDACTATGIFRPDED
jgi:hypothetical protein